MESDLFDVDIKNAPIKIKKFSLKIEFRDQGYPPSSKYCRSAHINTKNNIS